MNNIAIVGGGTAGVITALKMQRDYGNISSITMIRSEEIGILGAGEGSTPNLIALLNELDITTKDLIRNTYSTIKIGINFQKWTDENSSYVHPFTSLWDGEEGRALLDTILHDSLSIDDYNLYVELGKQRKTLSIEDMDSNGAYAIHFDAAELAKYLESVAISRGVTIINDKVVGVETDYNDYIESLILENTGTHKTDFVFDCSGFRRLIIGEFYGTEWASLRDYLPMSNAQPFFLPPSENPHPWTDAIAQDAGWIWKIPLQHRYGCGYVYDENYISNESVKEAILEQYPEADIPDRTFNFEAGYFKKQFVKNCMAIGLASTFVEPLEATSIFAFILQLKNIPAGLIPKMFERNNSSVDNYLDCVRDVFNQKSETINLEIAQFIQLHYITDREDTPFWKDYKSKKKFKLVEASLEVMDTGNIYIIPHPSDVSVRPFGTESYTYVGNGNKLINGSHLTVDREINLQFFRDNIKTEVAGLPTHRETIENLKQTTQNYLSWN